MNYLLDVNVLIAAVWTDHVHHRRVDQWMAGKSMATCALTELGFLRISTHQKALGAEMAEARQLLNSFITERKVEFIPADLPALEAKANRSEEVTDCYLAELAARKSLKLASLDASIPHPAVELIE